MQSQYANAVPAMLAVTEQERQGNDNQRQPDQDEQVPEKVVYIYPLEGGGVVFTETPIEDEPEPLIVDSQEPETDTRPAARREPPYFLHFLLILILFVTLDNLDAFLTLLTPAVTVTVTPQVKTLSTTATLTVGEGAAIHGRVFPPLTLTQSQTVNATGEGHQDAAAATGQLTFYNGQLQGVTVSSGTVFTIRDGIQIVTTETAVLPAADPSTNPPRFGQVSVSAQAVQKGASGNIQAFAVSGSCCAASVIVKNLAAFTGGQDARDFPYVTKGDVRAVVSQLVPRLLQGERAAFTSQLDPQESLLSPSCTPRTTADHAPGDEAQNITVTVSVNCSALAYYQQELQRAGERILTTNHAASLSHFQRMGDIHLVIVSQAVNGQRATLKVQLSGTWVYQFNAQQLTAIIAGKPLLDAVHLIASLPGVQTVSITGLQNNQALPIDAAHIHILVFFTVSRGEAP